MGEAVPLSLAEQKRRFEEGFDAALAALLTDLNSGSYRTYIRQVARERLVDGYQLYGDSMYRWPPTVRQANVDEEVADALVYLTSEASDRGCK